MVKRNTPSRTQRRTYRKPRPIKTGRNTWAKRKAPKKQVINHG